MLQLLLNLIQCEGMGPGGISLKTSAANLEGIHDSILFYLVLILLGVGWTLTSITISFFSKNSSVSYKYLKGVTFIEWMCMIYLAIIIISIFYSVTTVYSMDTVYDVMKFVKNYDRLYEVMKWGNITTKEELEVIEKWIYTEGMIQMASFMDTTNTEIYYTNNEDSKRDLFSPIMKKVVANLHSATQHDDPESIKVACTNMGNILKELKPATYGIRSNIQSIIKGIKF